LSFLLIFWDKENVFFLLILWDGGSTILGLGLHCLIAHNCNWVYHFATERTRG